MNAGDLNHIIRIDSRVETQDAAGQPIVSWATFVDNVPASVVPLSAREQLATGMQTALINVLVQIWWMPGVNASMRVVDLGENVTYNITGVTPDNVNGRTWLTLICTAGLTDGQ